MERGEVLGLGQIELHAAPSSEPRIRSGERPKAVSAWRLDLEHRGTVVRQEHAGDGSGDPLTEIEYLDAFEHAGHCRVHIVLAMLVAFKNVGRSRHDRSEA